MQRGSKVIMQRCTAVLAVMFMAFCACRSDDVVLDKFNSQTPAIDTLRFELLDTEGHKQDFWTELAFWSSDFSTNGDERSVDVLGGDHPKLTYKAWMRKGETPLVIILPGFSGHFLGGATISLANIFHKKGYSAVVLSNAMNWEFMEAASTSIVPGYTPHDAIDVYGALRAIIADLEKEPECKITKKILVGYSLGALHALFVSDIDGKEKKINFDRYVAINPPVDLMSALERIDGFASTWEQWRVDDVQAKVDKAVAAFLMLMEIKPKFNQKTDPGADAAANPVCDFPGLPVTDDEAKELIGFNFHMQLVEIIFSINKRRDFGFIKTKCGWFQRRDLYTELNRFNFRIFMDTFIKSYYSEKLGHPVSIEQLNKESSLTAIEASLSTNQKIRILHNLDDFLLNDTNKEWLRKTLGSRLTFFDHGGHLGNLYRQDVQERILKAAEE